MTTTVPEIELSEAQALHTAGDALFVDIRDPGAFAGGHVPGALRLHDGNAQAFLGLADKQRKVVVYCYTGKTSVGAVEHFLGKGFKDVVNLAGGFEGWRSGGGATEAGAARSATAPAMTVTPAALEKVKEYLGAEPPETAIRVTLEANGKFGLSLDEPQAGDRRFELGGAPFLVDEVLCPAVEGLTIDFSENVRQAGFVLEGGSAPQPAGRAELLDDVKQRIAAHKVMIFMKGTANSPMCGFSARAVEALRSTGRPFGDKNVLEEPDYRFVLSEFSNWPTIPQVFVNGKFVGGCDIVLEMQRSGDLQKVVDEAFTH